MAQRAWEAYKRIWSEWQAPHDLEITWPFALLGEAVIEQEDDPPGLPLTTPAASPILDNL